MDVSGELHALASRPGIHCTGGWVGPRVGLGVAEKRKIRFPLWNRTPTVQPVDRRYTD
jgi:hypothetical protein